MGWPVVYVARDVMTRDPDRVECGDTLVEVARRMRNLLVAFLPVCDERGDLQGVIALRDLLRGGDPTRVTASSLAQQPPITIGVDDPIGHVVSDLMAAYRMWLLPVLDGPRLVGVVHYGTVRRTPPSADPPANARRSSRDPLPAVSGPAGGFDAARGRADGACLIIDTRSGPGHLGGPRG